MKKAHEYREMSVEELESLIVEKSEDMLTKRMALKMQRLDNPLTVRSMRRDIAVIQTVLTEKKNEQQ
ncbi:MAG: 50S ribosomal protein L29 [bacterium]|nr:50S ribosomal protein L29 [bacterium]MCP4798597.1 50S ribosomal protein L29 [bacterium]